MKAVCFFGGDADLWARPVFRLSSCPFLPNRKFCGPKLKSDVEAVDSISRNEFGLDGSLSTFSFSTVSANVCLLMLAVFQLWCEILRPQKLHTWRVGVQARNLPLPFLGPSAVDIRAIGRAEAATSQLMQLVAQSLVPPTFRKCSQSSTSWQCWSVGRSS